MHVSHLFFLIFCCSTYFSPSNIIRYRPLELAGGDGPGEEDHEMDSGKVLNTDMELSIGGDILDMGDGAESDGSDIPTQKENEAHELLNAHVPVESVVKVGQRETGMLDTDRVEHVGCPIKVMSSLEETESNRELSPSRAQVHGMDKYGDPMITEMNPAERLRERQDREKGKKSVT